MVGAPEGEGERQYRIVSTHVEALAFHCFICRAEFDSEAQLFQHRMANHRLRTPSSRFGPQRKKSLGPVARPGNSGLSYLASFRLHAKARLHCIRCNVVFEDEAHLQRHRDAVHKRPTRAEAIAAATTPNTITTTPTTPPSATSTSTTPPTTPPSHSANALHDDDDDVDVTSTNSPLKTHPPESAATRAQTLASVEALLSAAQAQEPPVTPLQPPSTRQSPRSKTRTTPAHSSPPSFLCSLCPASFRTPAGLRRHSTNAHHNTQHTNQTNQTNASSTTKKAKNSR